MDDLPVTSRVTIPGAEIGFAVARGSGPGGQHVNKTETKVELRWRPADSTALSEAQRARVLGRLAGRLTRDGDLIVAASDHRSQHRNRETARGRLAEIVRRALAVEKRRVATKPRKGSIERRIKAKKQRGERKKSRSYKHE